MSLSFRTLATMSLSTLIGLGMLTIRGTTVNRASAEQFQPIKEAAMPQGFPDYTPVGQIEVKQYPAYRKASAAGTAGFWTLFQHIRQNSVKMTAPVEMDFGDPTAETPQQRRMAFLYETPDQGNTGTQGNVEVSDVSAATVVSIGCRGRRTSGAIAEAQSQLLTFLEENKDAYTAVGPMRVMGYNSPFVPQDKNFFEVQIPVETRKDG